MSDINTLFFDIGGVCLTNGWDYHARQRAAEYFSLNYGEIAKRHDAVFEDFECGKITRTDYLQKVIFYESRPFSHHEFIHFMQQESRPHGKTLELLSQLSQDQSYLLATINNESLELNQYRITTFGLDRYFTAFFSSSFVGMRKPNPGIFDRALKVLQKKPHECLFIDDREENVQAASDLGLETIHLTNVAALRDKLIKTEIHWQTKSNGG